MKQGYWGLSRAFVLVCAVVTLVLGGGTAWAAEGDFVWAKGMGGTGIGNGKSVAVDTAGNVYTAGNFQSTVDFDPGSGVFNLTSAGDNDVFVSKLDANGNFVWAKSFRGTGYDFGLSLAMDSTGNVYTTGHFEGTADFDPGVGTFNLTSVAGIGGDMFVSKLDTNGNFVWVKAMGGGVGDVAGYSIKVDVSGNVYTTGYFQGTVDFDPGVGTLNLTDAGGGGNFVSKLNANGNFIWAKAMVGAPLGDFGYSVAVDGSGNVYTAGYFNGTTDFDPGAGVFNLTPFSTGGEDIFVSKLDMNGNFVWAKSMGDLLYDGAYSLTVDAAGNVYTTGYFFEFTPMDFDPGPGTYSLSSAGGNDIFISKLDTNGNFVWARAMGGTASDIGNSIAVDSSGNVYTTGEFQATADFDPGVGIFNLTAAGGKDIFVSKLDASGNLIWAQAMGGSSSDYGDSLAMDASGNVYTVGSFGGTADFDPGAGIFNLTSAGGSGIFVLKLSGPPDTTDPTFTSITASPGFAEISQTVTITFTASEPLQGNPTVTVNTNVATFSSMNGLTWQYTYTVTGADALGAATIEITGQDTSGNIGISTNDTSLVLVMAGGVPLAAWPGILALAAAGALVLRRRK